MIDVDRSSWRRVRFGDAVQSITNRVEDPSAAGVDRYVGLDHLDPGSLTINRWGSPSEVEATKLRFQPGDVVFARRRAYQRKLGVARFEGIASAHSLVLRARQSEMLPEFLPVFLSSDVFMERAIQISVGSLSPTVNWKTLAAQEFDLPPLVQQRRFSDLIWAIENERRCATNELEALVRVRGSFLPEAAAQVPCCRVALGDLAVVLRDGPFGSKIKTEHYVYEGGVRVLRLQNLRNGRLSLADEAFLDKSHVDSALTGHRVQEGEILVAGMGDDVNPVGRACIVEASVDGAVHKSDVFRFRPDETRANAQFLVEVLNSTLVRDQVLALAQGGTRMRINTTNFRKVIVPLPSLADQESLNRQVRVLESAQTTLERRVEAGAVLANAMSKAVFAK